MTESNGKIFFDYHWQKLKSFFLSKDILSFLLFLVISATFWYVHALGKERETTIMIPVKYIGVPLNLALTNDPPLEISVDIKDQGITLFEYSDNKHNPLTIDLSRFLYQKGEILITSEQIKSRLSRYFKPSTKVLVIHPDSLMIRYEKLSHKTLPVEFVGKIDLAHQYMFSSGIKLQPNMVTVFGPKNILDTLKTVRTEYKVLKNMHDTISFRCSFVPLKLVQYSSKDTKVTIFVEQFTEGKAQIPINVINNLSNLSVRTFPAFVNVTYTVGLSQFKLFNSSDIQVYLDYNELKTDKANKHFLKINNQSTYISNIRISPLEVEYILEQK